MLGMPGIQMVRPEKSKHAGKYFVRVITQKAFPHTFKINLITVQETALM
jgi:hypothetical protein